ncbi:unnamed protein product, partial [Vitis vinifera]|uniref:Uncharacterized protein n=1 Tax=Vitis vinifera TaxID=29760 RepID=D7SWZ3_VITVI
MCVRRVSVIMIAYVRNHAWQSYKADRVLLEPNPYYMLVVSLCRPVHMDLRNGKKGIATCISFLLLMVVTCRCSNNLLFPLCIT